MKKLKSIKMLLLCILIVCVGAISANANITIPSDTSIGIWDSLNRTYTLTTDVNETIVIGESNVILDGNDFSVIGAGSGAAVYMLGGSYIYRTDVTVKNLNIDNFYQGIYAKYSSQITIENNTITNCPEGIYFIQADDNLITYNSVSGSIYHAIYLNESENNTIVNNTLTDNLFGTYFGSHSHNNTVYNNNFIDNSDQALVVNSTGNIFNLPEPTGGNHFSDWTGPDNDSNGFVDFPYVFTGGQDNLPFVVESAWENKPPVANAGIDQSIHVGQLVTLDGSASTDPDENYPLEYQWQFSNIPLNSNAVLLNADSQTSMFIPDVLGDYYVDLVVTDNQGLPSEPDTVLVSTFNAPPVAEAGDNIAVIVLDSVVQLDGSQSYDDEGDDIIYLWTLLQKPAGSAAELSDPTVVNPTFIADVQGDYIVELIVADLWDSSQPDTVEISFENIQPVADPGQNQSAFIEDTVILDGSDSFDENGDPLTYLWSIVSKPQDSLAELSDVNTVQTSIVPDLPGEYIISLVVNDGFINSLAANVSITAITNQDAAIDQIMQAIDAVNALDDSDFKNRNLQDVITRRLNFALELIDREFYAIAYHYLRFTVLPKIDGCADSGEPDRNDWITNCDAQEEVYPLVIEALDYLEEILQ